MNRNQIETVRCDFCGRAQGEAEYLFAAPGGLCHVCDECVERMGITLAMERNERGKE